MSTDINSWIATTCLFTVYILNPGLVDAIEEQVQRCHVCVSPSSAVEVQQIFPEAVLVPCHISSEPQICPPSYKGCLTQTGAKGSRGSAEKMLSCARLSIDMCSVANGVEYCYCSGQLCNAPQPSTSVTLSDDEDFIEGSGKGLESHLEVTSTRNQQQLETNSTSRNHTSSATLLSASMLTTIILPLVCR